MPRQTITCPVCGAEVQIQVMVVDPRGAARARWDREKGTKGQRKKQGKEEGAGPIEEKKEEGGAGRKQVPCGVRHQQYNAGCVFCQLQSEGAGDEE